MSSKPRRVWTTCPTPFSSVAVLALCGVLSIAHAAQPLPRPCGGGSCGASPVPLPFSPTPGTPGPTIQNNVTEDGTKYIQKMTVNQIAQRQIFNWQDFDIGAGYKVYFDQKDASYTALNRIWSMADPSHIYGSLGARGQVILINQNGIIFENGAQVNVGSLVASSLNIGDKDFFNPIFFQSLNKNSSAAFLGSSGYIRVMDGARLTTAKGGSIWLFAPEVTNSGLIQTEEGQVLLAAGRSVYLQASDDPGLRGFLVEVDSGGGVKNTNLGQIIATRGNATLVGIAVNQEGRVSATTSATLNGSIKLLARDTRANVGNYISASNTAANGNVDEHGKSLVPGVILGANSETSVTPELGSGLTSADSQKFMPSTIDVYGHSIQVQDNALVRATSGIVNFTAANNPSQDQLTFSDSTTTRKPDIHVYFAPGSVVDVGGTRNVALAMESNSIQANLQGAQLADAPLQHNGFLKGKTVWVDLRKASDGKLAVADISGYLGQIQRTVDERTTTGGTVNIRSEGDIVTRAGSRIDVSGGSVRYSDGFVKSTQLTSQGQVFDIATAPANRIYDGIAGVFTTKDPKWGVTRSWSAPGAQNGQYETGYVEGKKAGMIALQGFAYALDGQMLGKTTVGERQQASGQLPPAATLQFGKIDNVVLSRAFTPSVDFATGATPLPAAYQDGTPLPANLTISTDALREGGFSNLLVYSGGRIHLPNGVNATLADGGSMTLVGLQVAVDGNITIHGGSVNLSAKEVSEGQAALTGLSLGADAKIDVSGLWVNDFLALANHRSPTGPLAINGGTVALSSQLGLALNAGSVIDVSGGGWLNAAGQVKAGNAGGITLKDQALHRTDPSGALRLDGTLLGNALGQGGTLTISTPNVRIGTGLASAPGVFTLDTGFFNQGGFERFNIDGQQQLELVAGAVIAPTAQNRVLDSSYALRPTGAHLADFSYRQAQPMAFLRRPVGVTLTALGGITPEQGTLKIGQDAVIRTDPGSAIKLSAAYLLDVNGTLAAPGGSITLTQAEGLSRGDAGVVDFSDQAGIWLGAHARLLAPGYASIITGRDGARTGGVSPGGTVNIAASNGYVMTDKSAVIDVSGASGLVDKLPDTSTYLAQAATIGGDAGQAAISATEGIVLDASLRGGVAVTGAQPGQLSVTLDNNNFKRGVIGNSQNYPVGDRTLVVAESGYTLPEGINPGDAIPRGYNGKAYVAADRLRGSGFGALSLSAEDKVQFAGSLDLTGFARSLTLDTPVIEAGGAFTVKLAAPYLTLANTRWWQQGTGSPMAGDAHLDISAAQNIDLIGSINLRGFKDASFKTSGDIRLIGAAASLTDLTRTGQLATSVDHLSFTARQIYPSTLTKFAIRIQDKPHGVIEVKRTSGADGLPVPDMPVLSAGGTLTLQAPTILQTGVLKAPLGVIVLDAGDYESGASGLTRIADGKLTLDAGSITSVSLENQLVPFGYVKNGTLWQYAFSDALKRTIALPPEKRIELKGAKVRVIAGAAVNLNGGGDLYAAEFLPGPGGSRDVLADPTMFAVLPTLGNNVAPFDFQNASGTTLKPGDSVYLSGGAGLAAGTYTLLPAQYALLPGAFAVKLAPGASVISNQALPQIDGSAMSAGYRLVAGTGIRQSGWSAYVVMPQAVVRNLAEYHVYSANTYFGQTSADNPIAPRLPQDAGQLILAATQALNLAPNAVAMAASGAGRGGLLDVVAPKIAVVDATGSFAGYLDLNAGSLSKMGAASILLGGRRTTTADGVSIQVGASDVIVANNAASPLNAPDLMLAARDHVTIADGSVIAAAGNAGSDQSVLHLDGPGALLRVTSGAQARVERATTGSGAGLLKVGANTKLTGAALIFDATGNTTIDATAQLSAQAVSLASSQIALGEGPAGGSGLNLTTALLNQVGSAADLTLNSYSTIDIFRNAHFDLTQRIDSHGNPLLSSLTLDSGAIVSHLAAGQSEELIAHQITLRNSGAAVSASGSNAGEFILTAKRLDPPTGAAAQNSGTLMLQDGAQRIAGFSQVNLNAGTQIVASGKGSLTLDQTTGGVLALRSPRVTARDKAQYTIDAGAGAVNILSLASGLALPDTSSLGAQLTIRGGAVAQRGTVSLHGGSLILDATQGDVVLGSDETAAPAALTDVSGWAEHFANQTRYYPGGKVTLQAEQGKVYVKANATVDVSGGRDSLGNVAGDAGQLRISAPTQTAQIDGTLRGAGGASARGGDFQLDVGTLSGAETLAQKLLDGGFNDSIQWRARNGDITLARYRTAADGASHAVTLKAANIGLEADAGSLDVAARLDASGAKGGHIALNAKQDITIRNGAQLDVSATGSGNAGGTIELQSTSGYIDLQPGSAFNAGGAAGNGNIRLRTLRTASNDDVQVRALGAAFNNVNSVLLEAYKVYSSSGPISAADFATTNTWYTDAKNFMANTSTIKSRLGVASDGHIQLAPGIEVQSGGDMTLNGDVSLAAWRYDPMNGNVDTSTTGQNTNGNLVAGVLTLRAAGNLNLNGSLSDGFGTASASSAMQGIESWSYRLAAGADFTRSSLDAVQSGAGDVTLASDKLVRTGTGFIDISAGRDVTLQSEASVIYTAGHATPRLPDYPRLSATFRNANFPAGGGDIVIQAGRDIVAAPESQLFTPWLYRVGALNPGGTINTTTRPTWWTSFADFKQGIGALGGGNVTVAAGRDINNLGVVAPTNGRLAGAANTVPDPARLVVQGGGDLLITAGRDINSGLFYVANGTGTVRAGGSLGSARQGQGNSQNIYTILGLGEGSFNITANGDLNLETVVNPTLLPQGSSNTTASVFSTYGTDSTVNLHSLNGNVIFADHRVPKISNAFSSIPQSSTPDSLFQFYPGRLEAAALQGDIQLGGPIVLMPTASGNLDFFAAGSILLQSTVVLSGANPELLPTPLNPAGIDITEMNQIASLGLTAATDLPGTPVQQSNDATMAYLVARNGDIVGDGTSLSAILAKPAWVEAGRDVKDIWLQVENHDANTVSTVRAGRDIVYTDKLDPLYGTVLSSKQRLAVSGPGRFEVLAGGNIDLGGSNGIVSRGNLDVANLPEKGADLYVLAGLGQDADGRVRLPDYHAFGSSYFDGSAMGQQALRDFFANVERQLRLNQALTNADVQQQLADYRGRFDAMAPLEKALLVFFSELQQGGVQGSAGHYQRGYQAIASLFSAQDYQGNINLFNSQIKTESGGDINLLAPGGLINVGLAKPGNTKSPSDQGIFTESGGVIRSFSSGDFLVNQSRVFTLQADDLLLWSTTGNIDAGKGSKTASATPPPRLLFKNGAIVLDTTNVVSGSGIGQIPARSGYKPGRVYLIAPAGDVNAGEAGIRVAGDLLIAAQHVIGSDNIQVGGVSVGVPATQGTSLAGLTGTGLSDRAADETAKGLGSNKGSEDALKRMKQALSGLQASFISVDVVGFGLTGESSGLSEEEKCKGLTEKEKCKKR